MAKELPYFQFEPAEYLTKDVSFCSLSAQGLFINLCAYYWQRNCVLTKEQVLRRLNYTDELKELIKEGVIDLSRGNISIKFLDKQLVNATKLSSKNSLNGSKGGRPKKPKTTEKEPKLNPTKSQTKGIREDKIIEEEIKEDKEGRAHKFAARVLEFKDYDSRMLEEFTSYWTESGETQTKLRFEKQPVFEIKKRLVTWKRNEKPNKDSDPTGRKQDKDITEFNYHG